MYDKVPKRNKTLMLAKMRGLYTKKYERVGKVGADIEVSRHSISDVRSEVLLVKSKGNKTSQKLYKSK